MKALDTRNDTYVALKLISNDKAEGQFELRQIFDWEVDALTHLSSKTVSKHSRYTNANIVKLLDSGTNQYITDENGQKSSVHFLAFEYYQNKTMREFILEKGKLTSSLTRKYFRQLLDALEYSHHNGYAHLDVKAENLVFDNEFNLKLIDFGNATKIKSYVTDSGTPENLLPEALDGEMYDPIQADIFSAGVLLFSMITGMRPFVTASSKDKLYKYIRSRSWDKFWFYHEQFSKNQLTKSFKNLFQSLVSSNPDERLSIVQVRHHEWLSLKKHNSDLNVNKFCNLFTKVPQLVWKQSIDDVIEELEDDGTPLLYHCSSVTTDSDSDE